MELHINYRHAKDKEHAFELVKKAVTPEYVQQFKIKADINYDSKQALIIAKGKGFKLMLRFLEESCETSLDVSFILRPLGRRVMNSISEELSKVI